MARLRAIVCVAAIVSVTCVLAPAQMAAVRLRLRAAQRIPVLWHRTVLRICGLRITEHGRPAAGRPLLILSNHASWLDIPVIGSRMPLSFIAKAEVEGWPVFGLLARLQRTVFVDRTRRTQTGAASRAIAARLENGDPMVLFPEGTSSSGNEVLPFRSALVGAARHALGESDGNVLVQPLSLAYTGRGGLPMGRQWRPLVAWYGDMDLAPHLWNFLQAGPVEAVLTWGDPIAFGPGSDRKSVTAEAEDRVRAMTGAALTGRAPANARRAEETAREKPRPADAP